MDEDRPTRFKGTRLWGTNLKDAHIENCELLNFDNIDLQEMQDKIRHGKLKIIHNAS